MRRTRHLTNFKRTRSGVYTRRGLTKKDRAFLSYLRRICQKFKNRDSVLDYDEILSQAFVLYREAEISMKKRYDKLSDKEEHVFITSFVVSRLITYTKNYNRTGVGGIKASESSIGGEVYQPGAQPNYDTSEGGAKGTVDPTTSKAIAWSHTQDIYETIEFRDFVFKSVSKEAYEVCKLVWGSPEQFIHARKRKTNLQRILRTRGWAWDVIRSVITEMTSFVKEL